MNNKQAFINFLYINRDKIKIEPYFLGIYKHKQLFISKLSYDEYEITIDNIDFYIKTVKQIEMLYRSFKVLTILN
jgi:hypothetical protein